MAALDANTLHRVSDSKLFVVGAGGIGCELLKNLVLTGFRHIEVIDLDTIDVSNLNRQFLFQKRHVGRSKVKVAEESCRRMCSNLDMTTYHDSIFNTKFNVSFFKKFDLVMNALDNRAARSHVNKMCLAANIPMIESASEGYLGQVSVIRKGITECYDCTPKATQKTFPGCTIRNTPSELIHCVVWAKHLFNQLFGEADADDDVSPDTADPELIEQIQNNDEEGVFNKAAGDSENAGENNLTKSTRKWAEETNYNSGKLFNKLFNFDIEYLLSMEKLWEKRKPPQPISWNQAKLSNQAEPQKNEGGTNDVLTLKQNALLFAQSIITLKDRLSVEGDGGTLIWDKDDAPGMDFVASAANIRAHIFNIQQKTMAGNIVPAIATTNAMVAGLIVMQALAVINQQYENCKAVYVRRTPNPSKRLLDPNILEKPNTKCYVCAENPEITIKLNTKKLTVEEFQEKVLKGRIGMLAPDVRCLDGLGTLMLISSEEGELEENLPKKLCDLKILDGSRLHADDFLQNYEIIINIVHGEFSDGESLYEVISESADMGPKPDKEETNKNAEEEIHQKELQRADSSDDDLIMVEENAEETNFSNKRKASEIEESTAAKKAKIIETIENNKEEDSDDDLVLIS